MTFKGVSSQPNFPQMESERLKLWYESGLVNKYLNKNKDSKKKFSFLDGPITANNPMGVHHAWGRSYKDLWQRFHTMLGDAGRYQNGFDCQGLWVEVEVEKELGFKSKKDIEEYGVANFINKCKERVLKFSSIQTEQSKRLGNFMDWDNSYFTMSDKNNYEIWNFIKVCWQKGWLYKGNDCVPWCPRCETAISQHEMLTEDYKIVSHKSVYLKFPLENNPDEYFLIWTTTPWTIPANTAIAIDPKIEYSLVDGCWVASEAALRIFGEKEVKKKVQGKQLLGIKYKAPYSHLRLINDLILNPNIHKTVPTDDQILPISTAEGTGLVHIAPSAGSEDYKIAKKNNIPFVSIIQDNAQYLEGLGELSGKNAKKHPELILDHLVEQGLVLKIEDYTHRYPACWRCKTELVWKIADEWYIAMDIPDKSHPQKLSLRKQMIKTAKKITWLPTFGLERELDWLRNMHDWLISKKNRYWGLALPIYECTSCGKYEVIGSKDELKERSIKGWEKFDGNSPHKPWIDEVKIRCKGCGGEVSRINDVGNVWLDAGIVPFSTMSQDWFPADFITESFPGQFKNWFYSMIAMSTVLTRTNPFKTVLGYASLLAEDGRPMHKSWGNSIEFNEGADKIGSDVMRWMFANHNPTDNMLFGYKKADDTRRRFHLIIWNVYNFFLTYANLDKFDSKKVVKNKLSILDKWIIAREKENIATVTEALHRYDPYAAAKSIEKFVSDLSLWYVRRSRNRVGPSAKEGLDKNSCHLTLYGILVTLSKIMAPFMPFITEEIYTNLTGEESVHLANWPKAKKITIKDKELLSQMNEVRKIVEFGLSKRKEKGIKIRQPLAKMMVKTPVMIDKKFEYLIKDEVNVKQLSVSEGPDLTADLDIELSQDLIEEGKVRELSRSIQELRKEHKAMINQKINIYSPHVTSNKKLKDWLMNETLANSIHLEDVLRIELIDED